MTLGGEVVAFDLVRSSRKSLGITVNPDSSLSVTAPADAHFDDIVARLHRRGSWILRTRRGFDLLRPRTPERRYISGETHRYLGKQYRLQVDPDQPVGVTLTRTHLIIGGLDASETSRVRNRVRNWYARQARPIMRERYNLCLSSFPLGERKPPRLIVRPLEKRWGSLTATGGSLVLNRRLVEANVSLIDYVIIHELCHLSEPDHGENFRALLTEKLPDWQQRKQRLERWMM